MFTPLFPNRWRAISVSVSTNTVPVPKQIIKKTTRLKDYKKVRVKLARQKTQPTKERTLNTYQLIKRPHRYWIYFIINYAVV